MTMTSSLSETKSYDKSDTNFDLNYGIISNHASCGMTCNTDFTGANVIVGDGNAPVIKIPNDVGQG